jgi:ubiquitin carboxyl-terminal hydrolase 7
VYKELKSNYNVAGINEYVSLFAEEMPEEEREAAETDSSIYAMHFNKEPTKTHGVPFKFMLKKDETFKDTKARLEKRTGIKGKAFEKIKFAVVPRISYSRPIYLNDGEFLPDLTM